jgi:hypothetical protein
MYVAEIKLQRIFCILLYIRLLMLLYLLLKANYFTISDYFLFCQVLVKALLGSFKKGARN